MNLDKYEESGTVEESLVDNKPIMSHHQVTMALESLRNHLDNMETVSTELTRLGGMHPSVKLTNEMVSDEVRHSCNGIGLENLEQLSVGMEETVGGFSKILHRVWDHYFTKYIRLWDVLNDIFRSNVKASERHLEYFEKVARTLKRSDVDKELTTSYTGLPGFYIATKSAWSDSPIETVASELSRAEYVFKDFAPKFKKVIQVIDKALDPKTFKSKKAYETNVYKALGKLGHPSTHIDKKYFYGGNYLYGYSFSDGKLLNPMGIFKTIGSMKGYDTIDAGLKLAFKPYPTAPLNLVPDVKLTPKEALKICEDCISLLKMSIEFNSGTDIQKALGDSVIKDIKKTTESLESQDMEVSVKVVEKDLKKIKGFMNSSIHHYITLVAEYSTAMNLVIGEPYQIVKNIANQS